MEQLLALEGPEYCYSVIIQVYNPSAAIGFWGLENQALLLRDNDSLGDRRRPGF